VLRFRACQRQRLIKRREIPVKRLTYDTPLLETSFGMNYGQYLDFDGARRRHDGPTTKGLIMQGEVDQEFKIADVASRHELDT
jgi:hypothetical protein